MSFGRLNESLIIVRWVEFFPIIVWYFSPAEAGNTSIGYSCMEESRFFDNYTAVAGIEELTAKELCRKSEEFDLLIGRQILQKS